MSRVGEKLQEAYKHIKPYMDKEEGSFGELCKMCHYCEKWYGKEHDDSECENMPCFKFWLAYVYLNWGTSWE